MVRFFVALLFVAGTGAAKEPDAEPFARLPRVEGKLDLAKLRTELIGEAAAREKIKLRLTFDETRVTEAAAVQNWSIQTKWNGPLLTGDTWRFIDGPFKPVLQIERGDKEYFAAQAKAGVWAESVQDRGYDATGGPSCIGRLRCPVRAGTTWLEFLKEHEILEASVEGSELVVFFPHPKTAGRLRERDLDGLAALVGWRCVFEPSGPRLRLKQVEDIVTAYTSKFDPKTKRLVRREHKRYRTELGKRTIVGAKEFGVLRSTTYSRFRVVREFDLPLRVVWRSKRGKTVWQVDAASLKTGVTFEKDAFAFQPPK